MNIMIKHSRQTTLLLSAFSALSLYSMEQDSEKPEPPLTSIFRNTVTGDKRKEQDYLIQEASYLVRQYTIFCAQQQPLNEKWRYKEQTSEIKNDQSKTTKALNSWGNSMFMFSCTDNFVNKSKRRDEIRALIKAHENRQKDSEKNNS